MPENKQHLDHAYELEGAEETRGFYDGWAATYDTEVEDSGYVTPGRAARALKEFAKDPAAPLLDLGCGTGISGAAFAAEGFTTIDGCDFSEEMLKKAEEKGIYRKLLKADLTDPLPFETGDYAMIAAIGVLVSGHAPPETLDAILDKLEPGGLCVFSLNDHALAHGGYSGRLNDNLDSGRAVLLFREHGEHLPKRGIEASVYVLRKN